MSCMRFDPKTRSLVFKEGRWDQLTAAEMDKIAAWARTWANRLAAQDRRDHPTCTPGGRVWRFGPEGDQMVATFGTMGRDGVVRPTLGTWAIRKTAPRKPYHCAVCSRKTTDPAWTPTRISETHPVLRESFSSRSSAPHGHTKDRYCDACVQRGGYFKLRLITGGE